MKRKEITERFLKRLIIANLCLDMCVCEKMGKGLYTGDWWGWVWDAAIGHISVIVTWPNFMLKIFLDDEVSFGLTWRSQDMELVSYTVHVPILSKFSMKLHLALFLGFIFYYKLTNFQHYVQFSPSPTPGLLCSFYGLLLSIGGILNYIYASNLYIYIKPKLLKLPQFSTSSLFLKY